MTKTIPSTEDETSKFEIEKKIKTVFPSSGKKKMAKATSNNKEFK
jgi:hypothetical protein